MRMNISRNMAVGGALAAAAIVATSALASGTGLTGWFKAFDKTLAPGEQYVHNITVRKYYNVSIRFQKGNSSSYLSFDDSGTAIVLKDAVGNVVANATGVSNGRAYIVLSNAQLAAVASVTAAGISGYADVVSQPVNGTVLSFSGTTAYINVRVHYPSASMSGYVFDDLTGEAVGSVAVAAYEDGDDVNASVAVNSTVSGEDGSYAMSFDIADSEAFDVYVDGYDVV